MLFVFQSVQLFDTVFGLFFLIGIIGFILWILALIDILKSDFRGQNDKLIWALVVLLGSFVGAILYFLIGRNQKIS